MSSIGRAVKSSVVASLLAAGLAGGAQAGTSTDVTFYFTGNCADCAAEANTSTYPVWATLTLASYVEGQEIVIENFVAFEYSGSNLVDPYSVVYQAPTAANRVFNADTIYEISGSLGASVTGQRFSMTFDDGLFFRSLANGTWSTCAPKGDVYYGGNSCFTMGADLGTGSWSMAPVPEPSAYALMGLGLLGLAWRRARAVGTA